MDALNKALTQLQDLLRSMTPAARITSAMLLVMVVASLGWLANRQMSGDPLYLLGGQSFAAAELSTMEAAFGKAGLSSYQLEGARLRIPRGQQAVYMAALADAGALPAHFGGYLDAALQNDSPWTSAKQREERLKIAKQHELALVIRAMAGIENAAVHYDIKKAAGFRQESLTTASVSVKPVGNTQLEASRVPMIRHLVAGAIAGLPPESVTVIDLNGRTYSGNSSEGLENAMDDPYLARMREHQANYENTIRSALSYVRGATVTVNVELNKELRLVQDQETIDPQSTAKASEDKPVEGTNTAASLTTVGDAIIGEITGQRTEPKSSQNRRHTQVTMAPLTIRRVSVSVGVPSSYFDEIWRQRHPQLEGQLPTPPDLAALEEIRRTETDKIRQHVAGILPPPTVPTDNPASLVTVTTFQHIADTIPQPTLVDNALGWLDGSWTTLGVMMLALVGLIMLRSLVRGAARAAAAIPPRPVTPTVNNSATEPVSAKSRQIRRIDEGRPLHEELADLVRDDPAAAASVLSGWIGKTS